MITFGSYLFVDEHKPFRRMKTRISETEGNSSNLEI